MATEDSASVWQQLRESMEQLGNIGRQKSDPAAVAKKLAKRAQLLRGRMAAPEAAEAPLIFLAFHKGRQRYGIPMDEVREVQALEQFSPVPKTPAFIPGIIHWRGAILTLLDLGKLFEFAEAGIADVHTCIIVEAAGKRIAVIAHEIEEISSVPKSQLKSAPELSNHVAPEWTIGVHDDNRLILSMDRILNDSRLVDWRKR